jgi:hypothetical protein
MVGLNQSHLRMGFGVFLLSVLGISTGFARDKTLTVNPDQSEVVFSLGEVLHQVHGTFDVQSTCTAKTHFMVPYVKWGLKDPSTFLLRVNKEVDMEITLVGQLSTVTPR